VWRRVGCVFAIGGKSHQYGKAVAIVGAAGAMWVERLGWCVDRYVGRVRDRTRWRF